MPYKEPVKRNRNSRVRLAEGTEVVASFAGGTVDAFGRARVSEPYAILGLKQLYDSNPLFYDSAEVSGSGTTSAHNANKASTTIGVTNATAGRRVFQSKVRGVYQAGKGLLFFATAADWDTAAGNTKRVGYFDDENGLFYMGKDAVRYLVRRTYVSGSAVDTAVAQSAWNLDKMDGTGPSGVDLDFDKTQILVIDFEWLGVGRVRFGWNVDGATYYCHELLNANNLSTVYMTNPNLPIRYEIENAGTGPADSIECICAAIISEGGQEDISKSTYVSRAGVPITLANQDLYTPLVSVRLKNGHESTKVNPIEVDVFATSTTNYEWKLFLNPSVSGIDAASWVAIDNSSIEYDVSRTNANTVSGGYILAGGYGSSTVQTKSEVTGAVKSFLTLGSTVGGTMDEFVLAVANIDGNGGTLYGGLTVGEYY